MNITTYEHQTLKIGHTLNGHTITADHIEALQRFHAREPRYFSPIYRGVKFNQHVGVIHTAGITVEILPKIDRHTDDEQNWRDLLFGMLKAIGDLKVHAPTRAKVKTKKTDLLDLYFHWFLAETDYLFRRGLVKKYRQTQSQQKALKGRLDFPNHIRKNTVHKERFHVHHTVYDQNHRLHQILNATLDAIARTAGHSQQQAKALRQDMPDTAPLPRIDATTFDKITLNRKTKPYEQALGIARLILLSLHPDLSAGDTQSLALMFDMNTLWEKFVYKSLKKQETEEDFPYTVHAQQTKRFWENSTLRPDILLTPKATPASQTQNHERAQSENIILDTKWKNIDYGRPSSRDLQQTFAYKHYFQANQSALVYPHHNSESDDIKAVFHGQGKHGGLIRIAPSTDILEWEHTIAQQVQDWIRA
ncbi:hypothetical protein FUAX_54370 (plasmid) [Fulvitalea axinellae]|uniref:Restriction endonuclease n=1 Tax=Fulvitalea axinellae TaxID=1182444 RepID=A0AAU9DKE7_9BACT|nr:hypothetical protein FUAX_54370 [Fulvitalea axinellae]